ncbi:MAG TPA: N-acetylmuramoyl-L-alanine amidase [Longimicrobiales bacterium]|nr:N-acetylmuramoyl-L-alanine amidase [Longimicrobiales bacterium]
MNAASGTVHSRAATLATTFAVIVVTACASTPTAQGPAGMGEIPVPGTPEAQRTPDLPPIPAVDGPLVLEVGYPPEGASIAASDSNFIFGQTGSGRAQLTINGRPIDVAPNGGFLAFIPVTDDGVYRLSATKDGQTATLERRVPVEAGGAVAEITGAYPTGAVAVQAGEAIEIGFRARPGVRAAVLLPDGRRIQLVEQGGAAVAAPGDEFRTDLTTAQREAARVRYSALVPITEPIITADTAVARPAIGSVIAPLRPLADPRDTSDAPEDTSAAREAPLGDPTGAPAPAARAVYDPSFGDAAILEVITSTDTIREPLRLNVAVLDPALPRVGIVTAPADASSDWTVRGRVDVGGPYHFFWPDGTRLVVTGQRGGMYRIRLSDDRIAWVPAGDVRILPAGAAPAGGAVAAVRFSPEPRYIDLRIPLPERLPFQVKEDRSSLHIDVFGAVSRINFFQYGRLDPLVAAAEWSQPAEDVLRVSVDLSEPVWGYDTFYDASGALVLRIRRPPVIDAAAPLRGMFIAVDPGHGGEDRSTRGPTDLREADANLQIALQLRDLLENAGARVMMTRTTDMTVPLGDRPRIAADSGAHVLLSVHNNAFPDGVNPWENNGTSTYYYHRHSLELARLLQRELLEELGLRDIGYGRADLALARPTWMPAVLTETAFMMIPQQEAALRDPSVQRRIAAAHVRALEAFLRSRAQN